LRTKIINILVYTYGVWGHPLVREGAARTVRVTTAARGPGAVRRPCMGELPAPQRSVRATTAALSLGPSAGLGGAWPYREWKGAYSPIYNGQQAIFRP